MSCTRAPLAWRFAPLGMILILVAALARGEPAWAPLAPPNYSFDALSPSVTTNGLRPDVVLEPGASGTPATVYGAEGLGFLGTNGDDLDALSGANADVTTNAFALLFSVHRTTRGANPPHPPLVCDRVPYNVQDQAGRGHAASDLFMSTQIFTRAGPQIGPRVLPNQVVVINNFNEGGHDDPMGLSGFQAKPRHAAHIFVPPGTAQDNVDATAYLADDQPVYFSARGGSPSLGTGAGLPGSSGADIFYDRQPGSDVDGQTILFADAEADLCLGPGDDIDALLVFDFNTNGVFDASTSGVDQVLFSLTPDSPSLQFTPGANTNGADVLTVTFHLPGCPVGGTVFAAAEALGLARDPDPDNLDALELVRCDVGAGCDPFLRGIRGVYTSHLDQDEDVDLIDIAGFMYCFTGAGTGTPVPPPANCLLAFDANRDSDIDLEDYDCFAGAITGPL